MQNFTAGGWTFEWLSTHWLMSRANGKIHIFTCKELTGCWLQLHVWPEGTKWTARKGGK
jgi:hypothetical protein